MQDVGVLADSAAEAARRTPGVAGLHAGSPVQVATYLPGRRVVGVRVGPTDIDVHVVLEWADDLLAAAGTVRHAVESATGRPTHVHVEDVVVPDEVVGGDGAPPREPDGQPEHGQRHPDPTLDSSSTEGMTTR